MNRITLHLHPSFKENCGAQLDKYSMHCTDIRHVNCPACKANVENKVLFAGDTWVFNFPATVYVEKNGIVQQSEHISSEAEEVSESAYTPYIQHTAEEVMDCLHSCETALRILKEKYGINLNQLKARVFNKNNVRNYYAAL